jgi:hypothetical protein
VLNTTGSSGGLTITGSGDTSVGGNSSGGTIQHTTGDGISLTSTLSPSFTNLNIQTTGDNGINGTGVTNFTFANGTINNAGDASGENSINFGNGTSGINVTGVVSVTNSVITNTEAEGIRITNFGGTIDQLTITGNTLSDTGDVATPGSAVVIGINATNAGGAATLTKADLNNNTITDFRAGAGFVVQGNSDLTNGGAVTLGTAGSGTNVINVTGNLMNGGNGGVGNQPDRFITGGINARGSGSQANFNVSNNGTAANRIRNIDCIAIELQADGPGTMTTTVQNNFINANSAVGCAGIAIGTDDPNSAGAGTHTTTVSGNNVMGTDGPGIFVIVRGSNSSMTAKVLSNTVAAPITTSSARAGIRADSGSSVGDTTLCLEIWYS